MLSPATRRAYEGHAKRFAGWARAAGLRRSEYFTGRALARFLDALCQAGKSPATISQAAAAIRKLAVALDVEITGKDAELVRAAIQRATRENRTIGRGSAASASWAVRRCRRDARGSCAFGAWTARRRDRSHRWRCAPEGGRSGRPQCRRHPARAGRIGPRQDPPLQDGSVRAGSNPLRRCSDMASYPGLDASVHPDGALFRNTKGARKGQRMSRRSVRDAIARRLLEAGAEERVSGHSLRRGSAASLVAAGASLVDVQEAGRWIDPRMPQHYAAGVEAGRGAVARFRYRARTRARNSYRISR